MKLLIVTQKVDENDDVLGFFHPWLKEFARYCEKVEVVCLFEGEHHLPANVRVHSLGKEKGANKLTQLLRFAIYVLRLPYSAVFVHMNPIYVCLAGPWWRLTGRKIALWYTHKEVDLKLHLAALLTDFIATAAPESFNLASKKVRVLGHGIEISRFKNPGILPIKNLVVSVGRITPIKHQDLLIEAVEILRERGRDIRVRYIGAPVYDSDVKYDADIKKAIDDYGLEEYVEFAGSMSYKNVAKEYWNAAISVNLLPTGGLDKAVFESLAAGTPALTTNFGFERLALQGLVICNLDARVIAKNLGEMLANPLVVDVNKIAKDYSTEQIVSKIMSLYG